MRLGRNSLLGSCLLLVGITACQQDSAPTSSDEPALSFSKQAQPYVITFSGTKASDLGAAVERAGGKLSKVSEAAGLAIASSDAQEFAARVRKVAGVQAVLRDMEVHWIDPNIRNQDAGEAVASSGVGANSHGDNETFYNLQWFSKAIHAPEAWDKGASGAGVRVAVLDGGLNNNHVDLQGSVDESRSRSFVPGIAYNEDVLCPTHPACATFSHATHVAGIIAAQDDGVGTIGVAHKATIIGVKVLHNGSGTFGAVIQGILYAADPISQQGAGAHIINMSLGADFPLQGSEAAQLANALSRATTYAYNRGVTVIASAGNDGYDLDHTANLITVPAQSANVIAISALGPEGLFTAAGSNPDRPASYTNFGQSTIDFAAPGGDFTLPGNDPCTLNLIPSGTITRPCWVFDLVLSPAGLASNNYFFAAGTSMAAPHAAGVAALIIEKNGGPMHPAQVEAALRRSADDLGKPGKDDFYGLGRVNALRAVQ